ncbi:MAG TPA: exodeoxyribonuclease VII large subunit [Gemmatimonadaceae bacterium]
MTRRRNVAHDAGTLELFEDAVPGASPASAIPVSLLTQTAREVLEGAFVPIWVRGEVTDFKAHRNGHWYFCLRDDAAQLRCVVWARDQRRIPAAPDEGMQVTALGQLTVYAARGEMQLTVKAMEAEGDGLWRKAVERTLAALERDGLLAAERKRPLPRHPRRIAIVTSPSGAAVRDIIAVARRRSPGVEIVVVAAKVQGDGAPEEICLALDRVARWRDADVVIVGRGGGGREDLWAFNDERVARAVAACPVPVVSAVGHEVDVTVCDLVADARAATPSAAAEACVPLRDAVAGELRALADAMRAGMRWRTDDARQRLRLAARDATRLAERLAERRRAGLEHAAARLHALSPLATLDRGYAIARDASGRTLGRRADFAPGGAFTLRVRDGIVDAVAGAARPAE